MANGFPGRIVHLSTFEGGGAGNAARRLHLSLKTAGANSTLLVATRCSNDANVGAIPPSLDSPRINENIGDPELAGKVYSRWNRTLADYPLRPSGLELFSDTSSTYSLLQIKEIAEADTINLHWVAGLLNYPEMPELCSGKKIIWTLHDMNPFTGGCHYAGTCNRYLESCGSCPQLGSGSDNDISRHFWEERRKAYQHLNITIVTPSRWLGKCASQSSLFRRYPVHIIPNSIPTEIFRPLPKGDIRRKFQLPNNTRFILFGADGLSNERKGFRYLLEALSRFTPTIPEVQIALAVFGSNFVAGHATLPFPIIELGRIASEQALALAYNLADIFVIPSLEDNLPNTVLEAMSCGVPVVGFSVGGIPDMIEHRRTGYLCPPGDIHGLVNGINWCMFNERYHQISNNCRSKCLARYSPDIQAGAYHAIYAGAVANNVRVRPAQSRNCEVADPPGSNETIASCTPDTFSNFVYSRQSHFNRFKRFGIYQGLNHADCDLKFYQDLLVYTYIMNSLPPGSRILEVGGGLSRVLDALNNRHECWNIDKFEGLGNGPDGIVHQNGVHVVADYMGNFNKELPDEHFDLVFSISALEHTPEDEQVWRKIAADIHRVLKPGGYSLHLFDCVFGRNEAWTSGFMRFLCKEIELVAPIPDLDALQYDPDIFVMTQAAYDHHWKQTTGTPYDQFGKPFSCNLLWRRPLEASHSPAASLSPQILVKGRLPRISIVTPSYNQAEYLEETIDSILSQGYPNLEYVIMDGGSTDGSVEIIRKYASHLTYWQSQPDGGQYFAINEGFRKTTGEIMSWLNSDDKYHPNALAKVACAFMEYPHVEWLTGRTTEWEANGEQSSGGGCHYIACEGPYFSRRKCLEKNFDKPWIQQESTFWKRTLWDRTGGSLNLDLNLAGDLELWVRFFRFAELHLLDVLIGGWRRTGENRATVFMNRYMREAMTIIDKENGTSLQNDRYMSSMPAWLSLSREQFLSFMKMHDLTVNDPTRRPCWRTYMESISALMNGYEQYGVLTIVPFLLEEIHKLPWQGNPVISAVKERVERLAGVMDNAGKLNEEGELLYKAGNYSGAFAAFIRAIQFVLQFDKAHCNLGMLYLYQGQADLAMKHLRTAIQCNPYNRTAVRFMSSILKRKNRIEEAGKVCLDYLALSPDDMELRELSDGLKGKPEERIIVSKVGLRMSGTEKGSFNQ